LLKKEAKAKHSDNSKAASRKFDDKYLRHSRLSLQRKKQLAVLLSTADPKAEANEAHELWNKKGK
jgi:hypothetical protein